MNLCVFFFCAAAFGQTQNLLLNPSFEEIAPDGRLAHWSSYVMPQDGAFAEADPLASDGSHAAMLHVPNKYDREPANNWSQVIMADFAGKNLVFAGNVRAEAAGEVALWVQCFTKNPARVAAAATSTAQHPVSGTTEWVPVEVRVRAPMDTDFIVVRCVLKGQGSAWFDDLRLEMAPDEQPELPTFEPSPDAALPAASDKPLQEPDLLEVSKMLNEAVAELQENNKHIMERVQSIQRDIEKNRAAAQPELAPLQTRHPLVPHGWTPEGTPR